MKKLIPAVAFLIIITFTYLQLQTIVLSPLNLLTLNTSFFIFLIELTILILLSSFSFVIFAALANDWRIVVPTCILASVLVFISLPTKFAIIASPLVCLSSVLCFISINSILKNYLSFHPISLFSPQIRTFSKLFVLSFTLVYFLSVNEVISTQGFQVPQSLIDSAISLTPNIDQSQALPQISQDQMNLLKQNPALLRQYGLDASRLNQLSQPQQTQSFADIKQQVKDQVQAMIKPYQKFIPLALSAIFYLTLTSLLALSFLLLYPLLPLTFWMLERCGIINFTTETREVRKIVV